MDIQNAKDRLLEVENLTDNLEDEDADWLINWGIDHLEPLIGSLDDDQQAGDKLNQLMQVMRRLNRIAGDPSAASTEEVRAFMDDYASTFGATNQASQDDPSAVAQVGVDLAALSPRDALNYLLGLVEPSAQDAAEGAGPVSADSINAAIPVDPMGQATPVDPGGEGSVWGAAAAESGAALISADSPAEQFGPPDPDAGSGTINTPDTNASRDEPSRRRPGGDVSDATDL